MVVWWGVGIAHFCAAVAIAWLAFGVPWWQALFGCAAVAALVSAGVRLAGRP